MTEMYRGKTENGWIYGGKVVLDDPYGCGGYGPENPMVCIIPRDAISWTDDMAEYQVIPETVGGDSCLQDKNGREMYVGDIVSAMFEGNVGPIIGRVGFDNGAFGLRTPWQGGEHFQPFCTMIRMEYEVIGNMTDTPEKYENS